MLQRLFYFEKLSRWDKISIAFYLALTAICGYYFFYQNNHASNKTLLLFYSLGTQLLLYLFCYKSLRNLSVFLIWIFIAIIHFFVYVQLKDIPELQNVRGHASTGLRNTIILLLLFQILRIVSVKTQKQELVAPTVGGKTDMFEGRTVTLVDFALFAVYYAAAIMLNV